MRMASSAKYFSYSNERKWLLLLFGARNKARQLGSHVIEFELGIQPGSVCDVSQWLLRRKTLNTSARSIGVKLTGSKWRTRPQSSIQD